MLEYYTSLFCGVLLFLWSGIRLRRLYIFTALGTEDHNIPPKWKLKHPQFWLWKSLGESCFVTFSWLRQLFCRSSRRTSTWSSLAMATLPNGQLKPVSVDYLTSIRHPRPLQPGILRDLDRKSWGVVVRRYVLILVMDHVFFWGRNFKAQPLKV